jgi:NAD(P)H dehydrogenase (quinone)
MTTTTDLIIVTGATGQLGSRIVRQLLARVPAASVGVSVRNPAGFDIPGVRVRTADYGDPSSLAHAFEGASQVLVVSGMESGEASVAQHRAAIDAAVAAGAGRIVYTSHQGASADSLFAPMPDHAATEAYLAQTGVPWTALRNGFYATTVPWLLGRALETGELIAPSDGPVSWTTHDDLAEAAAAILAGEATFDGPTPPLTGPEALDLGDVAGILTSLTGRTIRRVEIADDAAGLPELSLGMYRAARRGEFATTGPELKNLLGRPATPLRTLLESVVAPR